MSPATVSESDLSEARDEALAIIPKLDDFARRYDLLLRHARKKQLRGIVKPLSPFRFEGDPTSINLDAEYGTLSSWWTDADFSPSPELLEAVLEANPGRSEPFGMDCKEWAIDAPSAFAYAFNLAHIFGAIGRQAWLNWTSTTEASGSLQPLYRDEKVFRRLPRPEFDSSELMARIKMECRNALASVAPTHSPAKALAGWDNRLSVDTERAIVTLDGVAESVSCDSADLLAAMLKSWPDYVKASDYNEKPARLFNSWPERLQAVVERSTGKGYRLVRADR